jgi:caffeoyl-CoA O-methyltransferase
MHPDWQNNLHQYCEQYSTAESDLLKELSAWTWRNTPNPRMLSGHLQGRLLALFVQMMRPTCILEVGTFTGYSTLCLAEGLMEGAVLHSVEADAEHAFKANQFISKHPKYAQIKLHTGQALSVIPELNLRPNLAFIDADKVNYPAYLDMLLPMMQSGGLMLFDNTLWSGRVLSEHDRLHDADTKNMHAFNEKVNNLPNVQVLMMPIRDGLTAVLKS